MRNIQLRAKRANALKSSLKANLPACMNPQIDTIVDRRQYTQKTLRLVSAFLDGLVPTPETDPQKIMKWKCEIFQFIDDIAWDKINNFRLDSRKVIRLIRDYAEYAGKEDNEFRFQLLLLAASIETSIGPKKVRNAQDY